MRAGSVGRAEILKQGKLELQNHKEHKVIYVSFVHLSEKMSRDWYVDYLLGKGVEVEYWDLVPLLFGDDGLGKKRADYLRIPQSYGEVEEWLRHPENQAANFVMLVTYSGRFARLYRLLSKYNCRMFFISWGALPISSARSRWAVLRKALRNPLDMGKGMFYRLKAVSYRQLKLVKPFNVVFAAGRASILSAPAAAKVVPINMVDYERYALAKLSGLRVQGRYAVFLDTYLPHHPDLRVVGYPAIDPVHYYDVLNRFFGFVEDKFNVRVVIAAHPKADYARYNPFRGRETLFDKTAELVRDSQFAISHMSTSVSYVVLNYKPVVFIVTNEMERIYKETFASYIRDFSSYLRAPFCNVDNIARIQDIDFDLKQVDRGCYEKYKYEFLTSPEAENTTTQEIFWRELMLAPSCLQSE